MDGSKANLTLGELMKNYEHSHRRTIDRDSYLLLRLDGKNFNRYTRGLATPLDELFMEAMNETALALCQGVQGVRLAHVASDEISLLVTAWRENPDGPQGREERWGDLWMGGVEAKLLSLTASLATAAFNQVRTEQITRLETLREEWNTSDTNQPLTAYLQEKTSLGLPTLLSFLEGNRHSGLPLFDSRLWTFPATAEGRELTQKYFRWRQRDTMKNSVTMAALKYYPHVALMGKNTSEKQEMLRRDGRDWEALPEGFRFGRALHPIVKEEEVSFTDKRSGETRTAWAPRRHWHTTPLNEDFSLETTVPQPPLTSLPSTQ